MGLLVTLYLISQNTYGSVKAPSIRRFSYVEVWMIGAQVPILVALFEYGYVLSTERFRYKTKDKDFKKLDKTFACISTSYVVLFNLIYWLNAHSMLSVYNF